MQALLYLMLHARLRIAMADGKIFELKEILLRTQSPDGSVRKAGEAQLLELENQVGHASGIMSVSMF